MKQNLVYVPGTGNDGFLELARTPQGKLFRKQILAFGAFTHPNDPKQKLVIDNALADHLVENFRNGVCDIVQVPVVDGNNKHVEDPFRNVGEVVDLEVVPNKGVYAVIDARKQEAADALGKTLLGASAMMHMDYTDTRSGKKVGPTLLHVAVTNRPYITNLESFEEIIAASADTTDERPVLLSPANDEEEPQMDLDELLALLKDEHGIDVLDLQAKAEAATPSEESDDGAQVKELVEALSAVLREAGVVSLSNSDTAEELTIADVAAAVIELSQEKVELEETVGALKAESDAIRLSKVEAEIDGLVEKGRILPAQRDAMLELRLTNSEMFERLLPGDSIVSLSEDGVTTHDEPAAGQMDAEIARLAEMASSTTAGKKRR